jgi:hypothetical protein
MIEVRAALNPGKKGQKQYNKAIISEFRKTE